MTDPRIAASRLLGSIAWQSEVSGYCPCPGQTLHTSHTGPKDCRVNIDGAPTIFCFHASCAPAVAEANRRLRQELSGTPWQLIISGAGVLRNGDVLQATGEIRKREEVQGSVSRHERNQEKLIIESIRIMAERFRPELFDRFRWPSCQIIQDSPLVVSDRDPEDQFRTWLKLWPAHCHVWIGDVYSSGRPEHRTHFRPIADWYQIGPALGNYTCGSSFKPGSFRRSNECLSGHRFLVVESDILSKDEVGAIFAYLHKRLRYQLHCIIDTAGKSLHGWFDAPRNRAFELRLRAGLHALGCDPKVFTYSQPVRVPGAFREGRIQKLIWLKE